MRRRIVTSLLNCVLPGPGFRYAECTIGEILPISFGRIDTKILGDFHGQNYQNLDTDFMAHIATGLYINALFSKFPYSLRNQFILYNRVGPNYNNKFNPSNIQYYSQRILVSSHVKVLDSKYLLRTPQFKSKYH